MRSRRTVRVFAPAKINLTLHVTGRRADGYHLIDSLVAFADIGDWLTLDEAEGFRLEVIGTYGGRVPAGTENLVLRAAMAMGPGPGADILLEKELPVASGIGGGSADAAAAARGLAALRGGAVPAEALAALAALGADLPMCLASAPVRAEGIGERMTPLTGLPEAHLVLANPGRPVETAAAFARLDSRRNRPMPTDLPQMATVEALAEFLRGQRNDLEPAAEQLVPEIAEVRTALATRRGCLAARMSGSGATVFGLFAGEDAARAAQAALVGGGWWVAAGRLLADAGAAQPQLIRDTT